jgi:hypothetical protein
VQRNLESSAAFINKGLLKFTVLILQLGLLTAAIYWLKLENVAFANRLMPLILGGFILHHCLPSTYRLPFFLLLSFASIFAIFEVPDGLWLIGIGLLLIGLCHLPIRFSWRVVALLVAGSLLAMLRASQFSLPWFNLPWTQSIWPILGAMFMFRLIVYMYSLRHQKEPLSFWWSLSYFFLLPNVAFPLFPVIDFNTFKRTYYNKEPYAIYQHGVTTLFWGVVHLLAYRYVNYYLTLPVSSVSTISDLLRYMLTTFLLYLQVSGKFHLIVGILHLFGFNLPVTHHLYYLASSFTDFWRRINIYWKDFMLTIFYYPIYFRFRKQGLLFATIIATIAVFLCTWFLHAYQWFWLRGGFLLAWHDVLFWVILGVLVIVNIVLETKFGRKRSLSKRSLSMHEMIILTLKRIGTFSVICVLWSFWSSSSIQEWLVLMSVRNGTLANPGSILEALFIVLGIIIVMFAATIFYEKINNQEDSHATRPPAFFRNAFIGCGVLALLTLFSSRVLDAYLSGPVYTVVKELRENKLGRQDAQLLERGYYEDLIDVNRFNSDLWQLYSQEPADQPDLHETDAVTFRNDLLKMEIKPLADFTFKGAHLTSNQWGMRDQDYSKQKPPQTYRIAILGASRAMGSGVADEETFEAIMEKQLNTASTSDDQRYEILNFAVAGYNSAQNLIAMQTKTLDFEPDAFLYIAFDSEIERTVRHVAERVRANADLHYDYLRDLAKRLDINQKTPTVVIEARLKPYAKDIVNWAYREMVTTAKATNATAIWVYLPPLDKQGNPEELMAMAREAGFSIIRLDDVFVGHDLATLRIADWDSHPNQLGHQLIAEKLYSKLIEKDQILGGLVD